MTADNEKNLGKGLNDPIPGELVGPDPLRALQPIEATLQTPSIAEMAGFSPQLGHHILRLNEALVSHKPRVVSASLVLVPGNPPQFRESVVYAGYQVRLGMSPNDKSANLTIESAYSANEWGGSMHSTSESRTGGFGFLLGDIRDFVRKAFPARKTTFVAKSAGKLRIEDAPDDASMGLFEVPDEFVQSLPEWRKGASYEEPDIIQSYLPYHDFEILLDGQKDPLFKLSLSWFFDFGKTDHRIYFPLNKFYFDDKSADVERIMPAVTELFDKPEDYPYNLRVYPEDDNGA